MDKLPDLGDLPELSDLELVQRRDLEALEFYVCPRGERDWRWGRLRRYRAEIDRRRAAGRETRRRSPGPGDGA